MTELLFLLI